MQPGERDYGYAYSPKEQHHHAPIQPLPVSGADGYRHNYLKLRGQQDPRTEHRTPDGEVKRPPLDRETAFWGIRRKLLSILSEAGAPQSIQIAGICCVESSSSSKVTSAMGRCYQEGAGPAYWLAPWQSITHGQPARFDTPRPNPYILTIATTPRN
jgi:hypothetical protein